MAMDQLRTEVGDDGSLNHKIGDSMLLWYLGSHCCHELCPPLPAGGGQRAVLSLGGDVNRSACLPKFVFGQLRLCSSLSRTFPASSRWSCFARTHMLSSSNRPMQATASDGV